MRNEFAKNAKVFTVNHLIELGLTRNYLIKMINRTIAGNSKLILFGCNSEFYYELIPSLPSSVTCIDLLHAFVHANEVGAEHWSLPLVNRLNKRVVINQKVLNDFRNQYVENGINTDLLNRIRVIENYVPVPETIADRVNNPFLNIVYVGRDSLEKRVYLVEAIAKKCHSENIPAKFTFVGNISSLNLSENPNCEFKGEVTNENEVNDIYKKSDILLLTSSREGFPMVIMEAMMQGVVPISTNVGGISEHVINNFNGVLIDEINPQEIVEKFVEKVEYFSNNRSKLKELSGNAYNYALGNFNRNNFFQSYQRLLINQ